MNLERIPPHTQWIRSSSTLRLRQSREAIRSLEIECVAFHNAIEHSAVTQHTLAHPAPSDSRIQPRTTLLRLQMNLGAYLASDSFSKGVRSLYTRCFLRNGQYVSRKRIIFTNDTTTSPIIGYKTSSQHPALLACNRLQSFCQFSSRLSRLHLHTTLIL